MMRLAGRKLVQGFACGRGLLTPTTASKRSPAKHASSASGDASHSNDSVMTPNSTFVSAFLVRLCVFLLVGGTAWAVEPIVWKWSAGDTARYQHTKTMTMSMDAGPAGQVSTSRREDTVLAWTVDTVEDGIAQLSQSTERVVLATEGPMGQTFKYDSAEKEPPAGMAALLAPMFEAMIADPLKVTMAANGDITEVELTDELAESLKGLPGGGVSDRTIVETTKQGSLPFPQKALEPGDSWTTERELSTPQMGRMKVTTTYIYDGPTEVDGLAVEAFTPSAKMESLGSPQGAELEIVTKESDGKILFDTVGGRLVDSRVAMTLEIRIKLGDQEAVNTVGQTTHIRGLDASEEPTFVEEPATAQEPTTEAAAN